MARTERVQLNVRSAFARRRAHELARLTGMTATQVVEDALRAYIPPAQDKQLVPKGLVQRGPLLIQPANGRKISAAVAETAFQRGREQDLDR